ncbi:hypothetical protein SASPL_156766 [Salvia splendens]|uniref:Myb/SANT-like domain-containing protein n=1 Tax=Salvia splendens TaxID=180675 RepID=A0A8X8VW36_SALSN|nr:hypothetical protein SASPL_156766 [Salvia splendens]
MSDYIPKKFTLGKSQGTPEANLLLGLKDLVTHGWKADNRFRAGYLSRLEENLKREFPSTDLKGNSHINSKITAWKKSYNLLTNILDRNGVGFGYNGDFKIDLKHDRNACGMRNKAWPYLEQWKEIFEKDCANGAGAEDVMDAVNSLYSRQNLNTSNGSQDYNVSLDDLSATEPMSKQSTPDGVGESLPQSTKSTKVPVSDKSSGRKRKHDNSLDALVELLSKMHEDTNARLELTMDQKFDAGEIILEKVEHLNFFMGLPECARLPYVMRALEKWRAT